MNAGKPGYHQTRSGKKPRKIIKSLSSVYKQNEVGIDDLRIMIKQHDDEIIGPYRNKLYNEMFKKLNGKSQFYFINGGLRSPSKDDFFKNLKREDYFVPLDRLCDDLLSFSNYIDYSDNEQNNYRFISDVEKLNQVDMAILRFPKYFKNKNFRKKIRTEEDYDLMRYPISQMGLTIILKNYHENDIFRSGIHVPLFIDNNEYVNRRFLEPRDIYDDYLDEVFAHVFTVQYFNSPKFEVKNTTKTQMYYWDGYFSYKSLLTGVKRLIEGEIQ